MRVRVRLVVVVRKKSLGAGADNNNTKIMCAVVHYFLMTSLFKSVFIHINFICHFGTPFSEPPPPRR